MKLKTQKHTYEMQKVEEIKNGYLMAEATDEMGKKYNIKYAKTNHENLFFLYHEATYLKYLNRLIVEFLKDDNYIILITEAVKGDSISAYYEKPLKEKMILFLQVLDAVFLLHQKKVLHLNLKPSNIVIENGKVEILDFTFATQLGKKGEMIEYASPYMDPELLLDKVPTMSADMYSLGMIFFELITNKNAKEVRNDNNITDYVKVDKEFDYILIRCLNKDICYQNVLELKDDIEELLKRI